MLPLSSMPEVRVGFSNVMFMSRLLILMVKYLTFYLKRTSNIINNDFFLISDMKVLIIISLVVTSYGDIGLKLRQQQILQQNGGFNFGGDAKNNPFFIPKIDTGSPGNIGSAATNVEQRTDANTKTERTHTLEELCNDAFHSFLCKPVSGKRRRIDGNLRPGAVLPPGVLRPESSNTKENKLLPPEQSASNNKPNQLRPINIKQPLDSQFPAAQSEQGYFYPKPSNTFEFNKPLKNGYLPPDNSFRTTPRPTVQTIRTTQPTTTRPKTTKLPTYTFPTTQRPKITLPNSPNRPFQSKFDVGLQSTSRPVTTRISTTKPTFVFTQPRPSFTQPVRYQTSKSAALNTYLPPVTARTLPPPTTRAPFFTRPTQSTTRLPPTTRPPLPSSTIPPFRQFTTTYKPSTLPPIKFTTKSQTIANTYLPPFAEQRVNPVILPTAKTTPRPTYKSFPTISAVLSNSYLPPNKPAIDVRFVSASNTRAESAVLPDAAQNPSVTIKPNEEDNLERLCNDPFHSFLCQPVTKPRYRFDGRLRPQAVIPKGILMSNSFDSPVRALPELQSSSNIQAASIPSNTGYTYENPNNIQSNSQTFQGLALPVSSPSSHILSTNENSEVKSGYFYPAPSNTVSQSTSFSPAQTGYKYPKPDNNNQFNLISSTQNHERYKVTQQLSRTTPKTFTNNNFFSQNNLLPLQNSNQEQLTVSTERAQVLQTGYDYPKPAFNQQFTFPSASPNTIPITTKSENQFIFSSTPRPTTIFDSGTVSSTYKYQQTGFPVNSINSFDYSNPSNTQGETVSFTDRPTTLLYQYQNAIANQVSPSLPTQTLFNNQKVSNSFPKQVSTQVTQSTGYSYPKPDNPLQEQPTNNVAQGYFYPKPSISFPGNSLNSFGNSPFIKSSRNPVFNAFTNSISYSSNQAASLAHSVARQESVEHGPDPKTAKNINQLLGPSNESTSRDLPPASQFEILKVKKRQNG